MSWCKATGPLIVFRNFMLLYNNMAPAHNSRVMGVILSLSYCSCGFPPNSLFSFNSIEIYLYWTLRDEGCWLTTH